MTKTRKIVYWIFTIWMCLGMVSTAVVQLMKMQDGAGAVKSVTLLGYPQYMLTILGVWKLLGVIAVLIPGFKLLKEWAYAGFFFVMSGALISHLIMHSPFKDTFPSILLLTLVIISYASRPANRKIVAANA
jgi:uncharacterized membrane protein YphA (DoxX/SURF4 family)